MYSNENEIDIKCIYQSVPTRNLHYSCSIYNSYKYFCFLPFKKIFSRFLNGALTRIGVAFIIFIRRENRMCVNSYMSYKAVINVSSFCEKLRVVVTTR